MDHIRNTKLQSLVSSLPEEIVEEIFSNLPVKSLLRFRCVSKSWRSLIDNSKIFIKKHLHNSKRRGMTVIERCSLILWLSPEKPNYDDPLTGGSIIGCCNGVQCILNGELFLWNPATGIFITLPLFGVTTEMVPEYGWQESRCGFGWDEESDAYKVFFCAHDGFGVSLGIVYSSKTNSWKRVSFCGALEHYEVGVLVSGRLHWVPESECRGDSNYVDCIEYFDLKSEVYGRMKLPSEVEGGVGRWWLRESDGCLHALYNHNDDRKGSRRWGRWATCVIRRARETRGEEYFEEKEDEEEELFDEWVMEEYGVKESWVKKKTNIPILNSTLEYQRFVYVESLISPAFHQH